MVICGFGRAGQIHFNSIRKNHRCKLLYLVDQVENEAIRSRIQAKLDEFMMEGVKVVGLNCYEVWKFVLRVCTFRIP